MGAWIMVMVSVCNRCGKVIIETGTKYYILQHRIKGSKQVETETLCDGCLELVDE